MPSLSGNKQYGKLSVFKRDNGEPFRPNYITERFYHVIRKHKFQQIRFHDLRHSSASMLVADGFSLKEIQEFLGHGDFGTTANIYAHLQFKAKQKMADSMGSKLQIRSVASVSWESVRKVLENPLIS